MPMKLLAKNAKKSYIEKVVYKLSRLCHISADVTNSVTSFVTNNAVNIIITSGGNGGIPNAITFLYLKGGDCL